MTRLPFHTVDVFTDTLFAGNPLAIVEQADGLSTAQMQRIAREFNLSETIFIRTPAGSGHTAAVRIFTPVHEIPFAGHPTVGCAIHLAQARFPGGGEFDCRITLEEVAGLVPVAVARRAGATTAQFTAPVIPFAGAGENPDAAMAAAALGLDAGQVGFSGHAPRQFQGGPTFLFVPLADREALRRAWPAEPAWSRMTGHAGCNSVYLYCRGEGGTDFHARMYAPAAGIAEDPATGSASALLAAQLLASGDLAGGTGRFTLLQGEDMGRPSRILLEVDVSGDAIGAVRIAGGSVPVSSGTVDSGQP